MQTKQNVNEKDINSFGTIKRMVKYAKPYWYFLLISTVMSLALVGIHLYQSQAITDLVQSLREGDSNSAYQYVYIMIAITVLGVIASYFEKYTSGRFSLYIIRDIRSSIYNHIEKINIRYIEKNHTGEIVSRLTNNIAILQEFFENNLRNFIYHPLLFIGAFILLIRINWKLLLVSAITMVIALLLTFVITNPIKRKISELQKDIAKVNSVYQDNVNGIYLVKTYNLYKKLFSKYERLLDITLFKSLKIEKINSLLVSIGTVLSIVPIIVSIVYGGYLSIKGEIRPENLLSFIYLLDFLANSAGVLPKIITDYKSFIAVSAHLFEILDQDIEREGGLSIDKTSLEHPIKFENIKFSYDEGKVVLDGLSFEIQKGKTTALVGSSGSGKSTIIKLICGFYEVSHGQIKLWDKPLTGLNLKEVRSNISLVSQDIYLLPSTVAENISYSIENVAMKDIIDASTAANAHEFIEKLPEGYNSIIGERGNSLSGGQKQRIAIARAILKDSPILLLDEPTSALDTHSEILVQESLERITKNKTVIVIAHRLSTIKKADEIIVLDKGKIVGRGTHQELLEKSDLYRQLYKGQINEKADKNSREKKEDVQVDRN
ncbi:ABC transporter ATP-binding protein [Clostridium cellulovorans]|uniref:ABC transporter transmembrane region n=1 Tax=Clostridium cellulovorans (strain ATCC 35296 / DSM 3052 / OCM 3 / 743B) TaxID=573061 RepID=D9SQJ2_CLOC7|nr:ABC transporter ATP-binding protein [Clostridium cellulovorans]ADL52198.1 ABC transporter transmembrane region [Clostridium cellulovorans 743B]